MPRQNRIFPALILSLAFSLMFLGCATNAHKAIKAETTIENAEEVAPNTVVGQNEKGEVVTQRKLRLAEHLKNLQNRVYNLEAEIYGHESYGRKGLFGSLKDCLDKSGEVKRLPTKNVLTKNEDKLSGQMRIDNNKNLVDLNEEYFLDRIKRFESFEENYERQKEEYEDKIRICKKAP
jgi:hypothetical protein